MKPGGARIVAVLGMHRSGTSLITRALEVLGVSLGDRLMAPSEGNNAKGFFEDVDINELNIAILAALGSDWNSVRPLEADDFDCLNRDGWVDRAVAMLRQKSSDVAVFGFKDPRTAKLLPFWQEVFDRGEFSVKYLLALRNPASVADSLAARDGLPRERSYYLWLEHVLNSLTGTAGRAPVLVNYDDFFDDADRVLEAMAAGLGLEVDRGAREIFRNGFIDRDLRHTLHSPADLAADPSCPPIVAEVHQALLKALQQGRKVDPAQLARWGDEFDRTKPALILAAASDLRPPAGAPQEAALEILRAVARARPAALQSGFDREWYAAAYPDVVGAGLDPYMHYSQTGVFEGRHPGRDLVQSSQRVMAALAAQPSGAGEQHWNELSEMHRVFREREARLAGDVQLLTTTVHGALRDRAAELEQSAAQTRQAEAEVRRLMAEATAREAAHAAAVGAMQQEQIERMSGFTQLLAERESQHLQQFADARDRAEAALRQLGEAENSWQARLHALELERLRQAADLRREREESELGWSRKLAQANADALAAQAAAADENKELSAELARVRAQLDGIRSSVAWRAWALVAGRRPKRIE